ncbi:MULTISPECIES: hypothetical protein [Pseudomonas]|uniref:Uncharacterized protein n=1 Tax=Pseudomonas fluorescens TaxID=294 RepID=A0A5E6X893_PSEFL|nr:MULTISPECIES: hypothetical protein [Pseudomonas]VVN37772.1 hypothetical protein PS652_05222 [Pseudomonas fluorescens]
MSNSFIAKLHGKVDGDRNSRVPVTLTRFDLFDEARDTFEASYKQVDQDWLTLNTRDTESVELIFEHQTNNNKYKIKVNSGAYKDRTMSISKTGYVGAWTAPEGNYVYFELELNGERVLGDALEETTDNIRILNNNGNPLQMYKGKHYEYPDQWDYITDCDGRAKVEFYLTIVKRL